MLYALLDSPSVRGAYRFDVTPGVQTTVSTSRPRCSRAARSTKLGLAPLTSMFFFGENTTRRFDDFRPEVHDSDGLLLHFDTGEWLWRPLDNPPRINVAQLRARTNPRGFGLLQRDRDFANYQDIETRSELRPSAWVEPRGDWGDGHVELVEIPTDTELVDNIVAFWVPDAAAAARASRCASPTRCPGTATIRPGRPAAALWPRGATGAASHAAHPATAASSTSTARPCARFPPTQPPRAVVERRRTARALRPARRTRIRSPGAGASRFQLKPKTDEPVELRAYLGHGEDVLTETWSSVWLKQPVLADSDGDRPTDQAAARGR